MTIKGTNAEFVSLCMLYLLLKLQFGTFPVVATEHEWTNSRTHM